MGHKIPETELKKAKISYDEALLKFRSDESATARALLNEKGHHYYSWLGACSASRPGFDRSQSSLTLSSELRQSRINADIEDKIKRGTL